MTIGIITKLGKNYGALLQAYALKQCCEKMGAETKVIQYMPQRSVKTYKVCKFPWGRCGSVANVKAILHVRENRESSKRCMKFKQENMNLTREYRSLEELNANVPQFDMYISGSDQVWNPQIAYDDAFFLTFVKEKNKKASYAASIGLKELPESIKAGFSEKVKDFNFVSVRENQGKKILADLDIASVVAPDPTLILSRDDWEKIAFETIREPYILCYFVSFPDGIENIVEQTKRKYKYKVVNLMCSEESASIGDIKVRDAGPKEFLGLFKNAEFVITSSFHGTVFSMVFRKKFVSTLYYSSSSRVVELLGRVGLKDRIVTPNDILDDDYFERKIYTEQVCGQLEKLREYGESTLKEILACKSTAEVSAELPELTESKRIPFNIKSECIGCGACGAVCPTRAIDYVKDNEGFIVPCINEERCVHCGKCVQACHIQTDVLDKTVIAQYGVYHKDDSVRMHSRSGGVFVAFSDIILKNGGAIYGAVKGKDHVVCHRTAYTKVDRDAMCGSKYVQSDTTDIWENLREDLEAGKQVLFSGSPCQTAAVRRIFAEDKYPNLMLCDFVCHGVPSPGFWSDYLGYLEGYYKAPVDEIDFRDKKAHSWESHVEKVVSDGKVHYTRKYTNVFYSNVCLRESCYSCKYTKKERCSDITIADYWGIDDIDRDFNDGKGVSLLMLRTEKARELFDSCKRELNIIDTSGYEPKHYNLRKPTVRPVYRDRFWRDYREHGMWYVLKKYGRYDLAHRIKYRLKDHLE